MNTTRVTLLERIKNPANNAAWVEFDAIYRPMLFRFAQARGLSHADAEDIVQGCMGAISDHITTFEYDPSKGRFKGWLRAMVNNRWRNHLRGRREQPVDSRDLRALEYQDESPEETFDRVWTQEHLRYALRAILTEVDNSTACAYRAYVINKESVQHICDTYGMTANQLYKIKWRLTQRLREKMQELEGAEPTGA